MTEEPKQAVNFTSVTVPIGTRLVDCTFKLDPGSFPRYEGAMRGNHSFSTDNDIVTLDVVPEGGEPFKVVRYLVNYRALISKRDEGGDQAIADLVLKMGIEFRCDIGVDEPLIQSLGRHAAWYAWPYVRETASDFLRRAGFDGVPIPYLIRTPAGLTLSESLAPPMAIHAKASDAPPEDAPPKE
jgi:hypothetical protein